MSDAEVALGPSEQEFEERIDRYHALVELCFARTLTPEEEREMDRLGEEIDCFFAPFYEPIIARLEAHLHTVRKERSR